VVVVWLMLGWGVLFVRVCKRVVRCMFVGLFIEGFLVGG